jgi:hypothetical protein
MKKQLISEEFLRMQKLAGVITEGQYKTTLLILEDESIDEGLRDWIIKGLIAATTLAGIGKVYQMDQKAKENKSKQTEYYNNVLSKESNKMSDDDLFELGSKISDKTGDLKGNSSADADTYKKIVIDYAEDYIKAHPDQFAVGADGGIYQLSSSSQS